MCIDGHYNNRSAAIVVLKIQVCSEPDGSVPTSIGDNHETIYIDANGNPYLYYDTLYSR